MDLRAIEVFFSLIIAKAVKSLLDRRGVTFKSKKNVNYHSILLSSQNDQTGSVVVQRNKEQNYKSTSV